MQYLTAAEVARRFRSHEETVRMWVRQGKLKAVYAGGPLLVSEDQIAEFLRHAGRALGDLRQERLSNAISITLWPLYLVSTDRPQTCFQDG